MENPKSPYDMNERRSTDDETQEKEIAHSQQRVQTSNTYTHPSVYASSWDNEQGHMNSKKPHQPLHDTYFRHNNIHYSPYAYRYPPNAEEFQGNVDRKYFGDHVTYQSHPSYTHRTPSPSFSETYDRMPPYQRYTMRNFPEYYNTQNSSQNLPCSCNNCRMKSVYVSDGNYSSVASGQDIHQSWPPADKSQASSEASSRRIFSEGNNIVSEGATLDSSLHDEVKYLTKQLSQITNMFFQFMNSMDSKIQNLEKKLSTIQNNPNPVVGSGEVTSEAIIGEDSACTKSCSPSEYENSKHETSHKDVPRVVAQGNTREQDRTSDIAAHDDISSLVQQMSHLQNTCCNFMNSTELKLQDLDKNLSNTLSNKYTKGSEIYEEANIRLSPKQRIDASKCHFRNTEATEVNSRDVSKDAAEESSPTMISMASKEMSFTNNLPQQSSQENENSTLDSMIHESQTQSLMPEYQELEAHGFKNEIPSENRLPEEEIDIKQYFHDMFTKFEPEKCLSEKDYADCKKSGILQLLKAGKSVIQHSDSTGDISFLSDMLGPIADQASYASGIFTNALDAVGEDFEEKGKEEESKWDTVKNVLIDTVINDNDREERLGYLLKHVLTTGDTNPGLDFVKVLVDNVLVKGQCLDLESEDDRKRADRFLQAYQSDRPEIEFKKLIDQGHVESTTNDDNSEKMKRETRKGNEEDEHDPDLPLD